MHNIKLIRKDPTYFTKKFKDRNVAVDLKVLLDFDKSHRELIQKKEKLEFLNLKKFERYPLTFGKTKNINRYKL